jgi:hypothetical protein
LVPTSSRCFQLHVRALASFGLFHIHHRPCLVVAQKNFGNTIALSFVFDKYYPIIN